MNEILLDPFRETINVYFFLKLNNNKNKRKRERDENGIDSRKQIRIMKKKRKQICVAK